METFSYKDSIIGAVESMIGGRNENQDSYGSAATPHGMLVVVCDGMGGGPAGKTASTLATQAIIDYVSGAPADKNPVDIMLEAGKAANEAVLGAVEKDPSLRGMGTTCVCVLLTGEVAYIMHVGDSRCYQLRNGQSIFRTSDHSYVGALVKSGQLTEEEARTSSHSNIITRAIGIDRDLIIDVDTVDYKAGDRFALMSDGIWGAIPETQLVVLLSSSDKPSNLVDELTARVDRIGINKGGRHDNLTLAIIDVLGGSAATKPLNSKEAVKPDRKGIMKMMNSGEGPSPKEGGKKDYSPIDEHRKRTRNRLAIGVLCTFFVVFAFCIVYIFFFSGIIGNKNKEEAKVDPQQNEVLHQFTQNKEQERMKQEEQQLQKPENSNRPETDKEESKPKVTYTECVKNTLSKLKDIREFNTDQVIKDRSTVIGYKESKYREAVQYLQEAVRVCENPETKKQLEDILKDLNSSQNKKKILSTSSGKYISATGDAQTAIDAIVSKLNAALR